MLARLQKFLRRFAEIYEREIWQISLTEDLSPKARLFGFLRVISITLTGLNEIKIFSRAAALSYSTLLGIGPLIAIAVLVAGTVLNNDARATEALTKLTDAFRFVAPQLDHEGLATELANLLGKFSEGARSALVGGAGAGAVMLIVIVIQLFISIEESFNSIWGVRRGRALFVRIVMYWTLVTLGAVLALTAFSLLSVGTLAKVFQDFPWAAKLLASLSWTGPLIAVAVLVVLLACFYRFIPNTSVRWLPCLIGAVLVVTLLYANNYLAFFYVKSVLRAKSMFGSLSLIPVLMGGMYVFWLIVLLGGQVTYAVQNVHFRSSRTAWHELNHHSREGLSLLVLILLARRFKECGSPYTASALSTAIRVPTQIINESLNRLIDLGYVNTIPPAEHGSSLDYRYQPARPLAQIPLREFRDRFARLGASPAGERLDSVDPALRHFHDAIGRGLAGALGAESIDEVIERLPATPKETGEPAVTV